MEWSAASPRGDLSQLLKKARADIAGIRADCESSDRLVQDGRLLLAGLSCKSVYLECERSRRLVRDSRRLIASLGFGSPCTCFDIRQVK
jgi:hypothetical protein